MPLREFKCRACSHQFEALVRANDPPLTCRACGAADLEQLLSLCGIKTGQTTELALKAGRKRAKEARRDEIAYQREIESHHH